MVPLAIIVYLAIGAMVISKIYGKPAHQKHTSLAGREFPTALVLLIGWALSIVFWPLIAANEAID